MNSRKPYKLHFWNSHRQHAAGLFQTTSYDRLILSNSWFYCCLVFFSSLLL